MVFFFIQVTIDKALEYTPILGDADTPIDDILWIQDFVDNELDNNDNNTKNAPKLQSNSQPPTTNIHINNGMQYRQ